MKNIELIVSDNYGAYKSESSKIHWRQWLPCKCSELFLGAEGEVDIC